MMESSKNHSRCQQHVSTIRSCLCWNSAVREAKVRLGGAKAGEAS